MAAKLGIECNFDPFREKRDPDILTFFFKESCLIKLTANVHITYGLRFFKIEEAI